MTVVFEEQDGKTKHTLRPTGIPAGETADITGAGWNESLARLAESLKN